MVELDVTPEEIKAFIEAISEIMLKGTVMVLTNRLFCKMLTRQNSRYQKDMDVAFVRYAVNDGLGEAAESFPWALGSGVLGRLGIKKAGDHWAIPWRAEYGKHAGVFNFSED